MVSSFYLNLFAHQIAHLIFFSEFSSFFFWFCSSLFLSFFLFFVTLKTLHYKIPLALDSAKSSPPAPRGGEDLLARLVGNYYRGHVVEKVIGNMTRPASWLSKLFTSNTVNRVRVLINGEINQLISRCCSCAGLWICCRFCLCSSCLAEGGSLEESDLEGGSCEVTR